MLKLLITINLTMTFGLASVVYLQHTKLDRVAHRSKLAVFGTYCNNYKIRATKHYSIHKNWDEYPLMTPVCNVHYALENIDSVKYRGGTRSTYEFQTTYNPFFSSPQYYKYFTELHIKLIKEYEDYLKGKGMKN